MSDPGALIVVSNRLPVTIHTDAQGELTTEASAGGLVAALRTLHEQAKFHWVGHCGIFANESHFAKAKERLLAENQIAVPLQRKAYGNYYNGMSNGVLWPLFHYFPSAVKIAEDDWSAYTQVNEAFADTILKFAKPGDWVWVHDYQLMLLPQMLRSRAPDLHIAYFHHIPFPSSEVFRILPARSQILAGILGADYVAFHNYDYVRHFLSSVTRVLGNDIHVDTVHHQGRIVTTRAAPIGIDFQELATIGKTPETRAAVQRIKGDAAKQILLGIDRLDYTKGIPERLQAFRDFLRGYPDFVGNVSLIQLCVPSRAEVQTYGNLRAVIERMVGQINGEFAKPGYTPVQYLYRSMPMPEVIALYKTADVALVTPLRDGLNLVCKEYVAARDDEDGVLILSEFAGAAAEMGEALMVNPFDVKQLTKAIYQALTMETPERQRRMHLLRQRLQENDNSVWAKSFMDGWRQAVADSSPKSINLVGQARTELLTQLQAAKRIFLFIDNDGTLTPIASRPELAVPTATTLALLQSLGAKNKAVVTVVSGRPRSYCEAFFVDLPINVVSEHGAFVWLREVGSWSSGRLIPEEFEKLKPNVMQLLSMYKKYVPGSHIEEKEASLAWHYRQSEPVFATHQAKELAGALQQLLSNTGLMVCQGKKLIEIRQAAANKGFAVEALLDKWGIGPGDALVTVGDDTTDEDMHRVRPDINQSIYVGRPNAFAKFFVPSSEVFLELLVDLNSRL